MAKRNFLIFLVLLAPFIFVGCLDSTGSLATGEPSMPATATHKIVPTKEKSPTASKTPDIAGTRKSAASQTAFSSFSSTTMAEYKFTHTPTPTVTATPEPVLITYFLDANDGGSSWPEDCLLWHYGYQFVLFQNGRLVIHIGGDLAESILSQQEIDKLLEQIRATGYLDLPDGSNSEEGIYKATPPYVGDGGSGAAIFVRGKAVHIYDPLREYVIDSVLQTEKIIKQYKPKHISRYVPEELVIDAFDVTYPDPNHPDYPFLIKPDPNIAPWTLSDISLPDVRITTFNGDQISPLLSMFPRLPMIRLFSQNGRTFRVIACPLILGW